MREGIRSLRNQLASPKPTDDKHMRVFLRKLKGRLRRTASVPSSHKTVVAELPPGGYKTSVERALNSRCSSDYDDDPTVSHWGMFDKGKELSDGQIREIMDLARICRFTDLRMEVRRLGNDLILVSDHLPPGTQRDCLMVENGMQQQALALVCAALGVGVVFQRQKSEDKVQSPGWSVNLKIRLDPMHPSHGGSFWSSSAPAHEKPWKRGNLPDPARDGTIPLVEALGDLRIENLISDRFATEGEVSQLLWAARGRTPHLYKSKPWGMTIPTSEGRQDITSVSVISPSGLFRYVNWHRGRPTHSLFRLAPLDDSLRRHLEFFFSPWNCFILSEANEAGPLAWWEVGYQLLNLLLQAQSIKFGYRAILLDYDQRNLFQKAGLTMPAAVLCLCTKNDCFGRLERKGASES